MSDDPGEPGSDSLVPQDEALLFFADAVRRLTQDALAEVRLRPKAFDTDPGAFLSAARWLVEMAETVLDAAIVVEIERGATWADIGEQTGVSRQSAHERWRPTVGAWSEIKHRRFRSPEGRSGLVLARELDEWYGQLVPNTPAAVSSGLSATAAGTDRDRRAAEANRAEARRLHRQAERLMRGDSDLYNAYFSAPAEESEAAQATWAGLHTEIAGVYERLAKAEPTQAEDHRASALKSRQLAAAILTNPSFAKRAAHDDER